MLLKDSSLVSTIRPGQPLAFAARTVAGVRAPQDPA